MGCMQTPLPPQAQTFLLLLWPLHKLTPTECTSVYMCMAIPAASWGLIRETNCEIRQLLLFSFPSLQGLTNGWILGLISFVFLELASVCNDNFLLKCFCCTLPVSLPSKKKWLWSTWHSGRLSARVKPKPYHSVWFYPASNFTSCSFQFWARERFICCECYAQVLAREFMAFHKAEDISKTPHANYPPFSSERLRERNNVMYRNFYLIIFRFSLDYKNQKTFPHMWEISTH